MGFTPFGGTSCPKGAKPEGVKDGATKGNSKPEGNNNQVVVGSPKGGTDSEQKRSCRCPLSPLGEYVFAFRCPIGSKLPFFNPLRFALPYPLWG